MNAHGRKLWGEIVRLELTVKEKEGEKESCSKYEERGHENKSRRRESS